MKNKYLLTFFLISVLSLFLFFGWLYNDTKSNNDYPVDLVYLWVDGDDPTWLKKRIKWQLTYKNLHRNGTDISRFRQIEELKYSLRSVEKNIPWINHIYIITDNQVPKWLNTNHPKITIIDHSEIFPKDALPTFNSTAIETRVPYIPNLSEHFLLANDDNFIRVPLEKNFFYNEQRNPRIFVKNRKKAYTSNLWLAQIKKAHELIAEKYPINFIITPSHNIQPYRKSYYLDAVNTFPNEFKETTYSKFRQISDISRVIIELNDRMKNRNEMFEQNDKTAFPPYCETAYSLISNNFLMLDKEQPCLFCLNDFEGKNGTELDITLRILKTLFPNKSSFEK